MPNSTYRPLATVLLSGGESSITLSSIPSTYRDLILVINGEVNASDTSINISFNDDTNTNNYPAVYGYANGGNRSSGQLNSTGVQISYMPNGGKGFVKAEIMDYSATDKHKTVLNRQNDSSGWIAMWAARWANKTEAINKILISFAQTGRSWNSGTSISLYGIEA